MPATSPARASSWMAAPTPAHFKADRSIAPGAALPRQQASSFPPCLACGWKLGASSHHAQQFSQIFYFEQCAISQPARSLLRAIPLGKTGNEPADHVASPEMTAPHQSPAFGSLAFIAVVVAAGAAAFAYTAGLFSPERLTPGRLVAALAPPTGPALGHRRNHAKGICFTGIFEANGMGSELSEASVFARGRYPVLGRFNLGTPNPNVVDATVRVRGLGIRISPPDGQEWRSAMINAPIFPVSTPATFYELLRAEGANY